MKTILLKLSGPLQSWGVASHFETRHTDYYPSKSAVIGIIAASLGYRRDEDENIQKLNELEFAVRIDKPGNILRDFHIAHYGAGTKDERNYVTNRYYMEDAIFVVAVSHRDDEFMAKIEYGLRNPYFQPYMGRRSAVMTADYILDVTSEDIKTSLEECAWQVSEKQKKKINHPVRLEVYADSHISGETHKKLRKDKVISFSQKNRKFSFRYESKYFVFVNNDNDGVVATKHDFWTYLGE